MATNPVPTCTYSAYRDASREIGKIVNRTSEPPPLLDLGSLPSGLVMSTEEGGGREGRFGLSHARGLTNVLETNNGIKGGDYAFSRQSSRNFEQRPFGDFISFTRKRRLIKQQKVKGR